MKLGFIGAGQMATALATGISRGGVVGEFLAYDPDQLALGSFEKALDLKQARFRSCRDNVDVAQTADYVILAVKPQLAELALSGLEQAANSKAIFVSVIAGLTLESLQNLLRTDQIIRSMPNTPCLIGEGVIACAATSAIEPKKIDAVTQLLELVGEVILVNENQMDAVTGLSGSGPAFVYKFVEALADAGVLAGLPRQVAELLALRTVSGSVGMLESTGEHPAVLRDRVASPGGTTIHGLAELEKNAFSSTVMAAVMAAADRSRQLSVPETGERGK